MKIVQLGVEEGERLRAIRLRALEDAPDAFGTTLTEASAWQPAAWTEQLTKLPTFIAVAGVSDVGLVRCAPSESAPWLLSLWVAPMNRGMGIGGALVDAAIRWARSQGAPRLLLDVTATNPAALALYRRKGFVPTGVVGCFPEPRAHLRELQMALCL